MIIKTPTRSAFPSNFNWHFFYKIDKTFYQLFFSSSLLSSFIYIDSKMRVPYYFLVLVCMLLLVTAKPSLVNTIIIKNLNDHSSSLGTKFIFFLLAGPITINKANNCQPKICFTQTCFSSTISYILDSTNTVFFGITLHHRRQPQFQNQRWLWHHQHCSTTENIRR